MSTARDTGLAALQNGDLQTAIAQLESAIQQDSSDFQALLYLGGAYGQAGRHMDAIKAMTDAVRLDPANAQARYNLGVAMEQGGYRDQALQVLQQALQLQPDYPKAKEALERIQHSHAHGNDGFGAPPSASTTTHTQPPASQQPASTGYGSPVGQPPAYGQQPGGGYTPPGQAQPPAYGQQPGGGYAPPGQAQPTYPPPGATTQMPAASMPPGQAQTLYGQPPGQPAGEPGLGTYSAPPPPKPITPVGQPGYAPPGGAYAGRPVMNYPTLPVYDDGFNIGRAFVEWGRALFTPVKLFSEMAGCSTNSSTWALFIAYMLVHILVGAVIILVKGVSAGIMGFVLGYVVVAILMYLVVWASFALFVHMFSRAFGSSQTYGSSFRAVAYSSAPYITFGIITFIMSALTFSSISPVAMMPHTEGSVFTAQYRPSSASSRPYLQPVQAVSPYQYNQPGQYNSPYNTTPFSTQSPFSRANALSSPITLLLSLFGALWGMILLGVAVTNIHQISGGAAAGVVALSVIVYGIVALGVLFLIGMVFGLALAGMMGGAMSH